MAEIARLSGRSDWIKLDFVERERTPRRLMELGIRLLLAALSLSNTISELEKFGVERSRKAVHDWIQKADLQPASNASPGHVALDEAVIRINGQQFWLYAAVDSETNEFLHLKLFPTTTTALTQRFLRELREKHDVADAVFLVDHAHHLAAALQRAGLRFRTEHHGNRNAVERAFREVKRRTSSFTKHVGTVQRRGWYPIGSNPTIETATSWKSVTASSAGQKKISHGSAEFGC